MLIRNIAVYLFVAISIMLVSNSELFAKDPTSNFVNSCASRYILQQMPGSKIVQQQEEVSTIKDTTKPTWLTKAIWKYGNKQYFGEFIIEAQGKSIRSLRVIDAKIREH